MSVLKKKVDKKTAFEDARRIIASWPKWKQAIRFHVVTNADNLKAVE